MSASPKERRDPVKIAPLGDTDAISAYASRRDLQAELAQRSGKVVSVGELMPKVLAITLAQGMSERGGRQ